LRRHETLPSAGYDKTTLAWLAIDVDPLIARAIEERPEEQGVRPVPVASGG
jgi:hypothetical protein